MSKAIPTSKRSIRKWIYKQVKQNLLYSFISFKQGDFTFHLRNWNLLSNHLSHPVKVFVRRVSAPTWEHGYYWEVRLWNNTPSDAMIFQDADYKRLVKETVNLHFPI